MRNQTAFHTVENIVDLQMAITLLLAPLTKHIILNLDMDIYHLIMYPMIYLVLLYLQD